MPDDQMRGLRDIFADIDDDADETTDLPRPISLGGLSGLGTRPLAHEPNAEPSVDDPQVPVTQVTDSTSFAPTVRSREARTTQLRHKTSFSLASDLRERISTAYTRDRWTMAELVSQGIERVESGRISKPEIERTVKALSSRSGSAIKSVNLGVDDVALLDDLATSMRLSRSQLISAVVSLVLDSL